MSGKHIRLLVLLLCLTLVFPAGVPAQPKAAGNKKTTEKVSLDFKDIELADLIQTISELTGRNFIYDETVRGKATIISPDPMTLDQAYNLFLTVLSVKGFTVVPSGKVYKVIPVRDAKESNLPTAARDKEFPAEQYVTRVLKLENLDATMVATTVLAPLVPKTSSVVAYPPSNSLIITDNAANIERLVKIIEVLDVPGDLNLLEVFPLQYADATEVAQVINQVLAGGGGATPSRRAARGAQAAAGVPQQSLVIAYPRTNALVALADENSLSTIKQLVAQLDQRTTQEHAGIYVYYLENADAETLATTLNQIVTGIKTQARTPATGARATRTGQATTPGQPGQPASMEAVAITADKATNSLIVNSTPEDYEALKEIIRQLDRKRRQVFVEALILELSMDATQRLGASLQGAFEVGNDNVIFGTTNQTSTQGNLGDLAPAAAGTTIPGLLTKSINGILLGGLFNPITVTGPDGNPITVPALSALIDVSKRTSDINILSAPRLLTSDNEEAEIIVGQNVPIITQRLTGAVGGTDTLSQSVAIERQDVALTLRFTPQITEGNLVRLNVLQEITDIAATAVGDVNQVGPTLTKRLVRNTVLAENGKTIVLGGLISNNQQETISKVPLLGDIPGLGWLFKHRFKTNRKTNLLVFITPKIIRDAGDLAMVTNRSRADMETFKEGTFVPQVNMEQPPLPEQQPSPNAPAPGLVPQQPGQEQ